jgi:hypothetical protein
VKVTGLAMAGGRLTARLAEPPSDGAVAAMKALGLTAAPTTATASAAPAADPASAPAPAAAPQDFQTGVAACR